MMKLSVGLSEEGFLNMKSILNFILSKIRNLVSLIESVFDKYYLAVDVP